MATGKIFVFMKLCKCSGETSNWFHKALLRYLPSLCTLSFSWAHHISIYDPINKLSLGWKSRKNSTWIKSPGNNSVFIGVIQRKACGTGFFCPSPGLGCFSGLYLLSLEGKKTVVVIWELAPGGSKRNCPWDLGYNVFHSRWKCKKFAYVNREMRDVAGASSQPEMRTLSAFLNIGGFLLNMMFPSNMFFSEKSYFPRTVHWQRLFVLFRINWGIFLNVILIWWLCSSVNYKSSDCLVHEKATTHCWVTCSLNACTLWWQ